MLSMVCILTACPSEEPIYLEPSITVDGATTLSFDQDGGSQSVTIKTNRNWSAEVVADDPSWIQISPNSGVCEEGEVTAQVQIVTLANAGRDREATVTFTASTTSATIKVKQTGSLAPIQATPISEIWAKSKEGSDVILSEETFIRGRVVSIVDETIGSSLNNKSMAIQDGTAKKSGIIVRFTNADYNVFELGAEVEVDMTGGKLNYYNGTLQATPLEDTKIVKTTADVEPMAAITVTTEEVATNDYQSMYIQLENAQVVSSQLNKKFEDSKGNTNIETADGGSIVLYVGSYAAFKGETVPSGAGVLKGLAGVYGSTYQIQPQCAEDYAGMTGTRFEVEGEGPDMGNATLKSISEIWAMGETTISDEVKIKGIVVSNGDEKTGSSINNKSIAIQDGTSKNSGIILRVLDASNNTFATGDEVEVLLTGAKTSIYQGTFQVQPKEDSYIVKTDKANAPLDPISVTIEQILNDDYQSMYVQLEEVQVVDDQLSKTMSGSVNVEDKAGNRVVMYTGTYAAFKDEKVPQGAGALRGLAGVYGSNYQIQPQRVEDYADMTGTRFTVGGDVDIKDATLSSIADVWKRGEQSKVTSNIKIKGVVVSNPDNETGGSINNKSIAIQDGTGEQSGIIIRVSDAASNTFATGDEIEVYLYGASLSLYSGTYQAQPQSDSYIVKTDKANAPLDPITVTMAQLKGDKYQSMYVQVADVQVDDADLSKKMAGSIKIVNKAGESVVMYTGNYAAFKDENVPQGSGTLKGLAGVYNSNYQIQPQRVSDYSGLTGQRFAVEGGGNEGGNEGEGGGSEGDGNYTSNVGMVKTDGDVSCYDKNDGNNPAIAVIGGKEYDAIKLGTSKQGGYWTTPVLPKTGDVTITFYAVAWKNNGCKMDITINNGGKIDGATSKTITLEANDGATSNPPYTITFDQSKNFYTLKLTGVTDKTTLKFSTESSKKRAIIVGLNAK